MLYIGYGIGLGYVCRFGLAAVTVLEISAAQTPVADDDTVRDADELRIGELDSRPGVAVVKQHIDAGGGEFLVQGIGRLLYALRLLIIDRHQHDEKGRQRLRP